MCSSGSLDLKLLNLFVENKAKVNTSDEFGNTPFSYYCKSGNKVEIGVIDFFIEHKVDLNRKNKRSENVFYDLCNSPRISEIEVYHHVIKKGFNIEENRLEIQTLFQNLVNKHFGAKNSGQYKNCFELCCFLLSFGFSFHFSDHSPENLLLNELSDLLERKGTVWKPSRHFYFPSLFRDQVFTFIVSSKIYSKRNKYVLPKPILFIILEFFSIPKCENEKKRKVQEIGEVQETSKRNKN